MSMLRSHVTTAATAASASLPAWTKQILSHQAVFYDTADLNKARSLLLCLPKPSASLASSSSPTQGPVEKHDPQSIFDVYPSSCMPLGSELVLFNPLSSENELRYDGTEQTWSPPEGLDQRMWASGSFEFELDNQMSVGEEVSCNVKVEKVEVKEGKQGRMVFVWRRLTYSNIRGKTSTERRCHVHRAATTPKLATIPQANTPTPAAAEEQAFDFGWDYHPTRATLFRYSAATFNAHRIHLDPEYCRTVEGHPDCLVHGPLTATLLMNLVSAAASSTGALAAHTTDGSALKLKNFDYRATAPLVVERMVRLRGTWVEKGREARLWALDDQNTVCMTAKAVLASA